MSDISALRQALRADPSIFPLELSDDGETVNCVRLLESDYRSASFLDHRLLDSPIQTGVVPWAEFEFASNHFDAECDFIFHVSHCGSTLLSRILGQSPFVLPLREPYILRCIAEGKFESHCSQLFSIWSRTFSNEQRVCLKASSFVSEIGTTLMNRVENAKAILMFIPLRHFLCAMLDGSMTDIVDQETSRLSRLQNRGIFEGLQLNSLTPGQKVTMSWLAEMVSLTDIATLCPNRVMWLNFEQFLLDPLQSVASTLSYLNVSSSAEELLTNNVLKTYAKKPDVPYDSVFRNTLLERASRQFHAEIQNGLEWFRSIELPRPYQSIGIHANG